MTHTRLELDPIGVVRSPFTERMEAPRQPRVASEVRATVELFPGHNYEDALSDLALWDHIWLVVWFHANQGWKPRVLPPRSTTKRGVFATRAPRRPNPIGLSAVRLLSVTHLSLEIQGVDLLDGTPVLDIKPYVPWADAIPEASSGWLAPLEATGASTPADPAPDFELRFEPRAAEQLAYLQKDHEVALEAPIRQVLKLGPQPHAYRRIRREGDDYRLAIKDWRIHFSAEGRRIIVREIRSGYRTSEHSNAPGPHRDFISRYHQA